MQSPRREVHPLNAVLPIVFKHSDVRTSLKLLHEANAFPFIAVTFGIDTFSSKLQPLKAFNEIVVQLGRLNSPAKLLHPIKNSVLTFVNNSVLGVKSLNFEHLLNGRSLLKETDSFNSTFAN